MPAPQIGDALLTLPCKGTIIDGEVVACREDGTADFRALHSGKYTQDILCVWCSDLMGLNREDLRSRSLLARKRKLAMLLRRHDHPYVRYSEPFENGFWFCAAWKAGQLGIFAMCTLYTYALGKRPADTLAKPDPLRPMRADIVARTPIADEVTVQLSAMNGPEHLQ